MSLVENCRYQKLTTYLLGRLYLNLQQPLSYLKLILCALIPSRRTLRLGLLIVLVLRATRGAVVRVLGTIVGIRGHICLRRCAAIAACCAGSSQVLTLLIVFLLTSELQCRNAFDALDFVLRLCPSLGLPEFLLCSLLSTRSIDGILLLSCLFPVQPDILARPTKLVPGACTVVVSARMRNTLPSWLGVSVGFATFDIRV